MIAIHVLKKYNSGSEMTASAPVKRVCPLLELVVLAGSVDRQGHHTHHHHHSRPGHKQHWVAGEHGQLGSQIAPPHRLPLCRSVHLVVVLAAKDAGGGVVVP